MTWGCVKIERTPRPFLTRCWECGWQFRVDQDPYSLEYSPWERTNPPRPGTHCRNVDCSQGPAARELRRRIRENPCHSCGGTGLIVFGDMECYCAADDCEAARLLRREQEAFERFVPVST